MFLDATTGERSKASLRLAELLEKDIRQIYLDPELAKLFPWSEQDLKLRLMTSEKTGLTFDQLLNHKSPKAIASVFEKQKYPDGLIVFFHDQASGYVRLKLFDFNGKERLLIRLPLEGKDSAMPDSLLKQQRRGAICAIGAAVPWTP